MDISYTIIRSRRKTIAIQIAGASVIVRAPYRLSQAAIREFVASKEAWIRRHLGKQTPDLPPFSQEELKAITRRAAQIIPGRTAELANSLGISYGRISLRKQKTRWGSCSAKGNLNFNCLLALAPPQVRDYVIIHELCHRKELNHSPAFWALVQKAMPDYRQSKQWLKTEGSQLIRRLPE